MRKSKTPTTDEVVELYRREKKRPELTMQKLDKNTVLIEGSAKALEFLGQFVLAHSRGDPEDCGNGLNPKGAGSAWFTKESTLGFYLHRLPCRIEGRHFGKRKKTKTV
jgi:hypothetical protein